MPNTGKPKSRSIAAARLLASLKQGRDVRHAKVKRIQQSIRAGTYENNLKLQVALERMLENL